MALLLMSDDVVTLDRVATCQSFITGNDSLNTWWEKVFESEMWAGEYSYGYYFADAPRGLCAGFERGPHCAHVSANHDGDVPSANCTPVEQCHVRGFHHPVSRFDACNQTLGLDHPRARMLGSIGPLLEPLFVSRLYH